jgi:hypothetical protein
MFRSQKKGAKLMNDILFANIRKARMEAEKEVVSENMMGIDFPRLLCECRPVARIMRTTEDFGGYEMEFKKGEW